MEGAAYCVAVDSPPEGEHLARLRAEQNVMDVHASFKPTRLVRPLEVARQYVSFLLEFDVLCGSLAVRTFRIDGPVARHIIGRLLLGDGDIYGGD